jgi:capsular exopolysaccharide synthesis family protein
MSIPSVPEHPAALPELNLREYVQILKRRRAVFIQMFVLVLAIGIVMAASGKPIYQTSAKLLVTATHSSVSIVDSSNPIAAMLAAAEPDSVDTQLQVLQSGSFLDEAFRQAHIVTKPGIPPPSVQAQALDGVNIIEVSVEGGDRQQITDLANTIVRLHLAKTDLLTTTGLRDTLQFMRREKTRAEAQLAGAEQNLNRFQEAHRLVGLTSEKEKQAGEYAALLARVLQGDSNIRSAREQVASLQAQLKKEPTELVQTSTRDNPRVAKLQDRLDDLKFKRTDLLREYKPTSRMVSDLDREIAMVQKQVDAEPRHLRVESYTANPARPLIVNRLQELQTGLRSEQAQYNAAAAQLDAQKQVMDSTGPWQAELAQLTSDRDAARGVYSAMSAQLRDLELRAAVAGRLVVARPIAWATVPSIPIRPRRGNTLFLAVILALSVAAGTVFLQEFLDDRVNSPDEVERLVPLRTLAHVPHIATHLPRLVAELPPNAPVAEAYRALRSSIAFAAFDAPIRRLQVTSSIKGEGKSTTAVNLATAMARDGKTVILVDADMRGPSVHRMLGLPESPGLSEVLAGIAPIEEALLATEIENLLVLPSGALPPNPAELLGGGSFEPLLQQLGDRVDIVIVDTPPCLPVTDPAIVATRMDAVILILQCGTTRKGGLRQTVELLSHARARLAGVVFNQVERQGGYYQSYPYYGYGYGHENGRGLSERAHRNGNGKRHPGEMESGQAITIVSSSPDSDKGA